jgi:DNA invertase Pin-like site-specific DNA recombinase
MNTSAKAAAVAYYRTSSAANVGADKDSLSRQQAAVSACAATRGLAVVHTYYDAAVSGADAVESREGFRDMLAYMLSNGARTIIVENASRFARDLIVQETGYQMLKAKGIELIAADSPDSFLSDGPTATLIRQILGAVAQFDKAMVVEKLRGARDRKSAQLGRRIEGAHWVRDPARNPAAPEAHVQAARAARAQGLSLRAIGAELAAQGFASRSGKPYSAQSIKVLIARA